LAISVALSEPPTRNFTCFQANGMSSRVRK